MGNANSGIFAQKMRDFNAAEPSAPSMVSQDESTVNRQRNRNLEFKRQFEQMANLNQE